jgi:hypothetical protein
MVLSAVLRADLGEGREPARGDSAFAGGDESRLSRPLRTTRACWGPPTARVVPVADGFVTGGWTSRTPPTVLLGARSGTTRIARHSKVRNTSDHHPSDRQNDTAGRT